MANTPSFFNLDQAQNNLKTIQGNLNNEISNIDTRNIQETKNLINSIDSDIRRVQQAINSNNMLEPLKQELNSTMELFQRFKDIGNQSIVSQKQEIQSFVNSIVLMNENLQNAVKLSENLGQIKMDDNGSINEIIKRLENLKNSLTGFIETSDIINFKESDLDGIRSKIMQFMSSLSIEGSKVFNIANMLMQSSNDPALQLAYKNMLQPLNDLINEIPDNVVKSFNKSQQQIISNGPSSATSGVDASVPYQELIKNLESTNAQVAEFHNSFLGNMNNTNQQFIDEIKRSNEKQAQEKKEQESQHFNELLTHINKITQASEFSKNTEDLIKDNLGNSVNIERKLTDVFEKLKNDEYSNKEKKTVNSFNGDGLDGIMNNALDIQAILNQYNVNSRHLDSSVKNYANASGNYSRDMSTTNFENLLKAEQEVKDTAELAAEALTQIFVIASSLNSTLDFSEIKFSQIPSDLKEVLSELDKLFKTNEDASNELLKVYDAFDLRLGKSAEGLVETMDNISNSVNTLRDSVDGSGATNKLDSAFNGIISGFGEVTKILGLFGGTISSITRIANGLGLNVGIPTNGRELIGYFGGSTEWYKKFAEQDYKGAMAHIAQGGPINDNILETNRQEGLRLQHDTFGKISYDEYSNMSNKLMSQIQNHYGSGFSKEAGQNDMNNMTGLALMLEKIYGVDSVNAVQTFYKELGMGSTEVNDLLGRLTGTAETANIPVSQYVKTISDMSLKFKELGVDIKLAETGIRNLTLSGMSMSNATDLMSGFGNSINKFTDSPGEMGFYGMVSGQFSNPWEAMWEMSDMWDANGNVKEDATQAILGSMSTKLDMFSNIYGADPNLQKWGISETFKDMGFTKKQSTMLTNAYMDGDYDTFDELFKKYLEEDENTVTLVDQDKLEERLSDAASKTDELTKAEVLVMESQQQLAIINKQLYDLLGGGLQDAVKTLSGAIIDLNTWLMNLLGMNGDGDGKNKAGNVLTGMLSNPLASLFAMGASSIGLGVFKGGLSRAALSGFNAAKGAGAGTSAALGAGAKSLGSAFIKGMPLVSGLLDGGITFFEGKGQGKKTSVAAAEGLGSGAGTGLGAWGGAALGTMILPGIGTAIGAALGGLAGGKVGKGLTSDIMDLFNVDKYEDDEKNKSYKNKEKESNNPYIRMGKYDDDDKINKNLSKMSDSSASIQRNVNNVTKDVNSMLGVESKIQDSVFESGKNVDKMIENTNIVSGSIVSTNRNIDRLTTQVSLLTNHVQKSSGESGIGAIRKNKADLLINPNTGEALYNDDDILAKNMLPKGIVDSYTEDNTSKLLRSQNENLKKSIDIGRTTKELQDEKYGDMLKFDSKRNDLLSQMSSTMSSLNDNTKELKSIVRSSGSGSGSSGRGLNGLAGANGDVQQYLNQDLRDQSLTSAKAINDFIDRNAPENSKMRGMGDAFMKAAEESGLDPAYLVAHAALETGWGTSTILNDKNNWFGIGAFDSSPYESAYGFNNLEAGIIEGAKWIAKNYTNAGQETLWEMINDPNGTHNYATDPLWAEKIASIMVNFPRLMANNSSSGGGSVFDTKSDPISQFYGTRGPNSYGSLARNSSTSRSTSHSVDTNNEIAESNAMDTSALNRDSSTSSNGNSLNAIVGSNSSNMFSSTVYNTGSAEYSNGAQHYNPMNYKDSGDSFVYYDAQAIARNTYLETVKDAKNGYQGQYKDVINSYDDRKSVYNTKPNFNINISVSSGENEEKYNSMAEQLRVAIGTVVEQTMGSSSRIAYSNYERVNSQYS